MADFPHLPLFTDAYLADTRHLTTEEHGAYLLLLMEAWRRPTCQLPDDDGLLARLSGLAPSRWAEVKPVIMAFWVRDGRRRTWTQKRLSKERSYVAEKSASQRDKAISRWKKTKPDDATALPERCPSDAPTPTPTQEISKEEQDAREAPKSASLADRLLSDVMQAVGLTSGRIPKYWMPPTATMHVQRWMTELGLSPERIVDAARLSRANHSEPPSGPKALDGLMRRLAAELATPPMTPETATPAGARHERARFDRTINELADRLNDGSVKLRTDNRDPLAALARRHPEAG